MTATLYRRIEIVETIETRWITQRTITYVEEVGGSVVSTGKTPSPVASSAQVGLPKLPISGCRIIEHAISIVLAGALIGQAGLVDPHANKAKTKMANGVAIVWPYQQHAG